jgi:hypothetical protein
VHGVPDPDRRGTAHCPAEPRHRVTGFDRRQSARRPNRRESVGPRDQRAEFPRFRGIESPDADPTTRHSINTLARVAGAVAFLSVPVTGPVDGEARLPDGEGGPPRGTGRFHRDNRDPPGWSVPYNSYIIFPLCNQFNLPNPEQQQNRNQHCLRFNADLQTTQQNPHKPRHRFYADIVTIKQDPHDP